MNKDFLLKELLEIRGGKYLENALQSDHDYQVANMDLVKKVNKLERIKLSQVQWKAVDKAISACNNCCAEYGRVAYHQGFKDALKLISELHDMTE